MGRKGLYEKLKSSDIGVCVDSYNTLGSLSWEAYLPDDFEEVIGAQSFTDPSQGFEIFYSPQYNEFYLREWKQDSNEDKIINNLKVISRKEVAEKIIDEQLVDELVPGWQRELMFDKEV